MKIIIFGASGTGKTTLGKSIGEYLNWKYLDSDDYYWMKTNPPFQQKIPLHIRNKALKADFNKHENTIVSGSLITWSADWNTAFDLGFFLRLSQKTRMERLHNREIERYGNKLKTDKEIQIRSNEFLQWAENYDDPTFEGASITQHRNWIKLLNCKVLEINGNLTNKERMKIVIDEILPYFE